MHTFELSPISPKKPITDTSVRVIANILKAVQDNYPITEQAEQLFNIQEPAHFLKFTALVIYSRENRGGFPLITISKRLYLSSTGLLKYLKTRHLKSNTEIEQEAELHFSKNKKGLQ